MDTDIPLWHSHNMLRIRELSKQALPVGLVLDAPSHLAEQEHQLDEDRDMHVLQRFRCNMDDVNHKARARRGEVRSHRVR